MLYLALTLWPLGDVERATGFRPRVEDVFAEPTVDGMVRLYVRWISRQEQAIGEGGEATADAAPSSKAAREETVEGGWL